jgi:hypothetical protein
MSITATRTPLSYSWHSVRWVAGGLLGGIYLLAAYCWWRFPTVSVSGLLLAVLVPAGMFWGLKRLLWADAPLGTTFDTENWYLHRTTSTETVPLKQVQRIKFTLTEIAGASVWKISYRRPDGQLHSLRLLPIWLGRMAEFREAVQQQNSQVDIVTFSHSFDFDQ